MKILKLILVIQIPCWPRFHPNSVDFFQFISSFLLVLHFKPVFLFPRSFFSSPYACALLSLFIPFFVLSSLIHTFIYSFPVWENWGSVGCNPSGSPWTCPCDNFTWADDESAGQSKPTQSDWFELFPTSKIISANENVSHTLFALNFFDTSCIFT